MIRYLQHRCLAYLRFTTISSLAAISLTLLMAAVGVDARIAMTCATVGVIAVWLKYF